MGELELKGLPDPVLADEVLWEPLATYEQELASRLPPLLVTGTAFAFAGRSDELAALTDAWKSSQEGPGHLVLLAGEPGIGKTASRIRAGREGARAGWSGVGRPQ